MAIFRFIERYRIPSLNKSSRTSRRVKKSCCIFNQKRENNQDNANIQQSHSSIQSAWAQGPTQWTLMGRMVREDRMPLLDQNQRASLIRSEVLRKVGMKPDEFETKLEIFLALVPDVPRDRLMGLHPNLLLDLCRDPSATADRLVELKMLFPGANVSVMIYKHPAILTESLWPGVKAGAQKLKTIFTDLSELPGHGSVDALVTQQPLLLVEDVDELLGEIQRLIGSDDPRKILFNDPGLVTALMSNRKLSLW